MLVVEPHAGTGSDRCIVVMFKRHKVDLHTFERELCALAQRVPLLTKGATVRLV